MSVENVPREAGWFIDQFISSVAQLEALLLLRTDPQRAWSPGELARELRLDAAWAFAQLEYLLSAGLLHRNPGESPSYQYRPRDSQLEQTVTKVAQSYIVNRVSVIERIYSKPSENIRAFADAFRLRKESSNG